MKLPRRTFLHLAASAAALPAVTRMAKAQTYPTRPVHMSFLGTSRRNGQLDRMSGFRRSSEADGCGGLAAATRMTRTGHGPSRNPAAQRDLILANAVCCHEVPGWGSRCHSID